MLPEQKQLITNNFTEILKIHEFDFIIDTLISKGIFTEIELRDIYSSDDDQQNKSEFLRTLQEKDEPAFNCLVQCLSCLGYGVLANALSVKTSGCHPFRSTQDNEPENDMTSSIETEISTLTIPINESESPLKVEVKVADEFCDSREHNPNLGYYHSRSKKRGRVLIINNDEFPGTDHAFRKGAHVDVKNLEALFNQMGGWVIETHQNKTAEEMRFIFKDFVEDKKEKKCDICFVFIMSHGHERLNTTIVFGKDGGYISTNEIQDYFTNSHCPLYRGKPKVFIYQVCRGGELDLSSPYTETDGKLNLSSVAPPGIFQSIKEFFRPVDDMLIGYATMLRSKAHRDTNRGTWYIELICEHFMNLAKLESVDNLLHKVDEGLRKRMSEIHTVQTSEIISKGFKKLYLNPGIYEANGILRRF